MRRKDDSLNTIMWSRHSRRTEPITAPHKRSAKEIVVLSALRGFPIPPVVTKNPIQGQRLGHKLVTKESGRSSNLPQVVDFNGEPWRARTSDPLIKGAFTDTCVHGHSSKLWLSRFNICYGRSRQRVYLLAAINAYSSEFRSQVGHKPIPR